MQVNKENRYSAYRRKGSLLLLGSFLLFFLAGCSYRHTPARTEYIDSTIYHLDTVYVQVPRATVSGYTD